MRECLSKVRGVAVFPLVLFLAPAWSQLERIDEMPKVLQELPHAGSMCRRGAASVDMDPGRAEAAPLDLTCIRPVAEVLPLLRQPNAVLVDLRSKIDHEKFHPTGSMLATASELISKPYWFKKTVVLMGGGRGDVDLASLCGRLKQRGYKDISVMQGGVLSWIGQQLPMDGHTPDALTLSTLTAAELWASGQSESYLKLVDVRDGAFLLGLKGAVEISRITPDGLRDVLREQRSKRPKGSQPWLGVVLVSSTSIARDSWIQLQQTVAPAPLMVFMQSHKDFLKESATQVAIWQSQEQGPKRPACSR